MLTVISLLAFVAHARGATVTNTAYVDYRNDADLPQARLAAATIITVSDAPTTPLGLTASLSGGIVQLDWTPSAPGTAPIAGYNIYRATSSGFTPGAATFRTQVPGAGTASFADAAVVAGVTYCYVVRAVDVNGLESASSNQDCAGLVVPAPPPVPPQPSGTPAAPVPPAGDIRVVVEVFDASGRLVRTLLDGRAAATVTLNRVGTGSVHVALRGAEAVPVLLSDGSLASWDGKSVSGALAPNGLYTVRVMSVLPDGRRMVTSATISIIRPYEQLIVSPELVPNPAGEAAWLSYRLASTFAAVDIRVYNVAGELLFEGSADGTRNSFKWDLRNRDGRRVAAGLYLVVIEAADPTTGKRDRAILKLAVEGK